jgi:hypothetical protein
MATELYASRLSLFLSLSDLAREPNFTRSNHDFGVLMKTGWNFLGALFTCLVALAAAPAFAQDVTLSPNSLSFGNQLQGTSSASQKVTLKNGQSTAIKITSIKTNLPDYTEINNCPSSPSTLAAGASCAISITFTPSALGSRTAVLTVTDTGISSPQIAYLGGTGIASVTTSPTSLSFGNQAMQLRSAALLVTVTNNQSKALAITTISTNLSDYTDTSTCPISPTNAGWWGELHRVRLLYPIGPRDPKRHPHYCRQRWR